VETIVGKRFGAYNSPNVVLEYWICPSGQ